jgi:uncharacterized membrane protein
MLEKLNDGNIIDSKDLQKYQQISPHKSAIDVVKSLQREDPQHPPLYFILTHFWMKSFGSSVTVIRCLAALFSLLSFPCIYWLCQELFASPQVGWLAIAVIAISPFHVLYAHEAREYSLWTVTILLSSAAFLRAIRLQTKFTWAIYALTITISLYTYLFSALVIFGHGIYLIIIEKFRLTKALIAYTISSLIGLILFIPLLYICRGFWNKVSGKTGWTSSEVPFISLVKTWILNFSRLFLDFNYGIDNKSLVIYLIIVAFVAYAIYFLCRHTSRKASLFVLILMGVTAFSLILPDLILGGTRSTVIRYLIPSCLGIEIAVAYLLATKINTISLGSQSQKLWQIIIIILFSLGIFSCILSSQAQFWWNKYTSVHLPKVAQEINETNHPILLTTSLEIMPLSYLLTPKVQVYWLQEKAVTMPQGEVKQQLAIPQIPDNITDIFLFNANRKKFAQQEQNNYKIELVHEWNYQIEPVYGVLTTLWKAIKK